MELFCCTVLKAKAADSIVLLMISDLEFIHKLNRHLHDATAGCFIALAHSYYLRYTNVLLLQGQNAHAQQPPELLHRLISPNRVT